MLSGDRQSLEGLLEDLKLYELVCFEYVPITSIHVECSFSFYKNVVTNAVHLNLLSNIRKCQFYSQIL